MRDLFRRYLQTRITLGEPEVVFPGLSRREALALVKALKERPAEAPKAGGPAADGPVAGERREVRTGEGRGSEDSGGEPALRPEEVDRLSREGTEEEIRGLPDLSALRAVAERCTRCRLHAGRRHVVFGEGDPDARVVCVGEAPGAVEDETGRPFVGRAGQLLDKLLLSVGFRRESVYICNVLKCRPPGNRDPRPDEVEACSPYLRRQLERIGPDVIVAFGTFAARLLLDSSESLGRLRGRTHIYRGFPVVVTYHPAALLRNPGWTRPAWEDLQTVRRIVETGRERAVARAGPAQGGLFG